MSKILAKKIVKKYAEKLKKENYPFSAIYLFGSYASNKASRLSDIDVAIISDKLKKDWNKNEDILWKYTMNIDSRIEPIGFTVENFKNNIDPIISEIKRNGIRIV